MIDPRNPSIQTGAPWFRRDSGLPKPSAAAVERPRRRPEARTRGQPRKGGMFRDAAHRRRDITTGKHSGLAPIGRRADHGVAGSGRPVSAG